MFVVLCYFELAYFAALAATYAKSFGNDCAKGSKLSFQAVSSTTTGNRETFFDSAETKYDDGLWLERLLLDSYNWFLFF